LSFETISLLLNWLELGALLAIMFRLSSTFGLIANTQRELRRAINRLGEGRATGLGINNIDPETASVSPHVCAGNKSTTVPDDLRSRSAVAI
jgi:hypothetical protein